MSVFPSEVPLSTFPGDDLSNDPFNPSVCGSTSRHRNSTNIKAGGSSSCPPTPSTSSSETPRVGGATPGLADVNSIPELVFQEWLSVTQNKITISQFLYDSFTLDLAHDNENYPLAELRLWGVGAVGGTNGGMKFEPGWGDENIRIEFVFDGEFKVDQSWLRVEFVEKMRCALRESVAIGLKEEFKERLRNRINAREKRHQQGEEFNALSVQLDNQQQYEQFMDKKKQLDEKKNLFELVDYKILKNISSRTQMSFRTVLPVETARVLGQMGFPAYFSETPEYFRDMEEPPLPAWVKAFYAFGIFLFCWMLFAWSWAFTHRT